MTRHDSWIFSLISEMFFKPCSVHESKRKNERNIFCIDCSLSFCGHCLKLHESHSLIQVRRYVYHDVVRLNNIEKHFNCKDVQSYTTNGAKVVFLNQRLQLRPVKACCNACHTCNRVLQEQYQYCSVACKVQHLPLLAYKENISSMKLYNYSYLSTSEFLYMKFGGKREPEEHQMTPRSILDNVMISSCNTSSASDTCSAGDWVTSGSSTSQVNKRKKRSIKGIPTRANLMYSLRPTNRQRKRMFPVRSPL